MQRRLVAFLLLAVFLGAGTTVPGPDVLLHHWTGQANEHRSHIEPAGGCGSHSEKCTLGRTATGAGAALVHDPVLRTDPTEFPSPASTLAVRIVIADPDAIPHSRAPPAHLV
jgi:hypothetical protein